MGTIRSGAKGKSTERADAAVVRQAEALEFFKLGDRIDAVGSRSPEEDAQPTEQLLSPCGFIWGACAQEARVSRADAPGTAVCKFTRICGIVALTSEDTRAFLRWERVGQAR